MSAHPDQEEEMEALKSIYDGDDKFNILSDTSFQYKFGSDENCKTFLLQLDWPPQYPDVNPTLTLDLFYNKHLKPDVRNKILDFLKEEMKQLEGMAMTFSLFETIKGSLDEVLEDQPEVMVPVEAPSNAASVVDDSSDSDSERGQGKERRNQMTKAQKRRMWDKGGAKDERSRGWNWMDLIRHLSQTGGGAQE